MLICESESLGYPIVDGIPHLLAQEALTIPTFDIATPDPSLATRWLCPISGSSSQRGWLQHACPASRS